MPWVSSDRVEGRTIAVGGEVGEDIGKGIIISGLRGAGRMEGRDRGRGEEGWLKDKYNISWGAAVTGSIL